MLHLLFSLFFCLVSLSSFGADFDHPSMREIPVAYKGRFRPLEAYSRLWLDNYYHYETLRNEHLEKFEVDTALEFVWQLHFQGHEEWVDTPLFYIKTYELKKALNLPLNELHFSYNQLQHAIFENEQTNLAWMKILLSYQFWKNYTSPLNRHRETVLELSQLSPHLVVALKNEQLTVVSSPLQAPWQFLKPGTIIHPQASLKALQREKRNAEEIATLMASLKQFKKIKPEVSNQHRYNMLLTRLEASNMPPKEISLELEKTFPLQQRLAQADTLLHLLPAKQGNGVWLPLKALKVKVYNPKTKQLELVKNFTIYTDEQFEKLRSTYFELENAFKAKDFALVKTLSEDISEQFLENYKFLEGTLSLEASGKVIGYPSRSQLQAEIIYYRWPLVTATAILYLISLFFLIVSYFAHRKNLSWSIFFLFIAFLLHTFLLCLRCYILKRPPVSNMFETLIYVPWIAVIASFALFIKWRHPLVLMASASVASAMFLVLEFTGVHNGLEVVQAVLDSQYWLIIHVLLVVGSYGAFALAALLGHLYLIWVTVKGFENGAAKFIGRCTVQSIYTGLAMLIPGTILGGVWAAESWGRFWDWDPKESWAFISICIYLIWIHAYRFGYIKYFGLAMGAVIGFLAISFTWYGVNYILGTGLHSYGFGTGGEAYYYLFILSELLFVTFIGYRKLYQKGFVPPLSQ